MLDHPHPLAVPLVLTLARLPCPMDPLLAPLNRSDSQEARFRRKVSPRRVLKKAERWVSRRWVMV